MGKKDKKNNSGNDSSGTYVFVGALFGLGMGFMFKNVAPFLFIGIGIGYLIQMKSNKKNEQQLLELKKLQSEVQAIKEHKEQNLIEHKEERPIYLESNIVKYKESLDKIVNMQSKMPQEHQQVVKDMTVLLSKIYEYVKQDTSRYASTKAFFQTYIGSLESILQTYILLIDQPIKSEAATNSMREIEKMLYEMKQEFEESYVSLYEKDVLQVDLEMQMLKKKFQEEKTPKLF